VLRRAAFIASSLAHLGLIQPHDSGVAPVTLHPILALDHVIDEYRDYLRTEFRAKDKALRAALERELDQPLFLAQEPFYQAHRPFKLGKRWRDLPIDPKLARVMEDRARKHGSVTPEFAFIHQSEAIAELSSPTARPLVVTTGTGSGKTEAFLLPVIQNAIEDAACFNKSGLTAILVYPMNALSNDQRQRIEDYLQASGFGGAVTFAQYDRGTSQARRDEMRKNPPHLLLTNYMMLEYLLTRPADREDIFANHRCRYLILDEVHTYRGTLGSNIALLMRRVRAHLAAARQDWRTDVPDSDRARRYPTLAPIGTSATIKTVAEEGRTRDEVIRLRDAAVQEFFSKLTGVEPTLIRVLGEELEELQVPPEAHYPQQSQTVGHFNVGDLESVRAALCSLGGLPAETPLTEAARRTRLLWDLNRWLISAPMSLSQLVSRTRAEIPDRRDSSEEDLRCEVETGLVLGAALPDGTVGGLRLRAHRLIRGGWQFHRCVNPDCGKLYPMGEQRCECGHVTAPLYLCRNCGADYLRFVGDPDEGPLRPSGVSLEGPEWMLYEPARFQVANEDGEGDEDSAEDEDARPRRTRSPRQPTQIKQRPVLHGSFDVRTLSFSSEEKDYALKVTLAPARTRCLCCGGSAGSRSVLTPVALGTSAAVKVLSEGLVEALADADRADDKQRLLVFSDSRQDAAHQARFIIFASRYDRMRRRVVQLLDAHGPLTLQRTIELLGELGVREHDNPYAPDDPQRFPSGEERNRIRAWEEAPVLDEIAVNAGYRATLMNLGLVAVVYEELADHVQARGAETAERLGISVEELEYVCRCVLDDMRTRGCVSRELLRYHPLNPQCPDYLGAAEWERRMKQPQGYPLSKNGEVLPHMDASEVPYGIKLHNAWRKPRKGGMGPRVERVLRQLLNEFGGKEPDDETMRQLLQFLRRGSFLIDAELYGSQNSFRLLQVNAERVMLQPLTEADRVHCNVCSTPMGCGQEGLPCPRCHGTLVRWTDAEINENRSVRRIRAPEHVPLVAAEHTAQVPNEDRAELEREFKAPAAESKLNLLACSPTLEMGIDVGGLDAVVLRNVPPRPDNYAQRGGRAGRRTRVGLVVGYARSTPHDQYFYDKPAEMIAGEVPAPALALGNRDVIFRHLNAIVFGAAQPGLAGKMAEYVSPTGEVKQETVDALTGGVCASIDQGIAMARTAFGAEVLQEAGLDEQKLLAEVKQLPTRIQDVVDRTARQVRELRRALDVYATSLLQKHPAVRAGDLVARLLGIHSGKYGQRAEADDRSAGYPLRRFAEFGILPGYEFPTEPASLRLLGDPHEEDPVTVARRFGIAQFQPDAHVYARTKRWKVIGLDMASPWNPGFEVPGRPFRLCRKCTLRFVADHPRCPRCGDDSPGQGVQAAEFGGFLARTDESPILDEEDRFATRNLVKTYPQWDGNVFGRWSVGPGWGLRWSRHEEVWWLNEGLQPSEKERDNGVPCLHSGAKGYLLCGACGHMLVPELPAKKSGGKPKAKKARKGQDDPYGHSAGCPERGSPPRPTALAATGRAELLRLTVTVPDSISADVFQRWGLSLGYALRAGMRHVYMLDGPEIEFELEGPWKVSNDGVPHTGAALTFVDPGLGGSGYLKRIAEEFHVVARRAADHLDHPNCDVACYRCLKSYQNQRFHDVLEWPRIAADLEMLAASPPAQRPLETKDTDDPRPWLEAFAAGVGSPLELKFLKLFEQHGFHPQKQLPIAPDDGQAPISIADFAVPERRVAIYIDGASFHVGDNLRRDRFIRRRIREGSGNWKVVTLTASDLSRGADLVRWLLTAPELLPTEATVLAEVAQLVGDQRIAEISKGLLERLLDMPSRGVTLADAIRIAAVRGLGAAEAYLALERLAGSKSLRLERSFVDTTSTVPQALSTGQVIERIEALGSDELALENWARGVKVLWILPGCDPLVGGDL
jgi:replicative superfamily II helicase